MSAKECGGAMAELDGAWTCERCGFRTRLAPEGVCTETMGPACDHAACARRFARVGRRDCMDRTSFAPRAVPCTRAPWYACLRWLARSAPAALRRS